MTDTRIEGELGAFRDEYPREANVVRKLLGVSFVALAVGGLFGFVQALHRTNVLRVIASQDYYTVLTAHGVLLALVFTTFFLSGIFTWSIVSSLGRPLENIAYTKTWVAITSLGSTLAGVTILAGFVGEIPFQADVMFTFYPPLEAHPLFYIGLALFIIGTWMAGIDWFRSYWNWRAENPGETIPLRTFMVLMTMLMWYLSTLGVAIEVVFFLIPWSLGLIQTVDPLLMRTLFWYFGHPVVYFWLMPAYLIWYTILPKLAGGRLFSDPLARIVFVLFLVLSTPVGFHHQYMDPGIPEGFKFLAMSNTMFLLLPSLLTAFTVVASIEYGARRNGGSGYLSWLKSLPWNEPAFAACALAGLMFAAGGFSGMVNAGMNVNYLVHNTLWIPGHFHLTVGTAVALTFMGMTYWLWPQLTGKRLQHRTLATVQPYLWFVGMTLMSNAMHRGGLAGIPRRTAEPQYEQFGFEALFGTITEIRWQIAVGGTLLTLSLLAFLVVVVGTWIVDRSAIAVDGTLPPAISGPEDAPRAINDLRLWLGIAVVLVALAYGPPIYSLVQDGLFYPGSPPQPTAFDAWFGRMVEVVS
jgi:cytochrome c oxidase subunit 1